MAAGRCSPSCFSSPTFSCWDISHGPRTGAAVYNAGHTYIAPTALAAFGLLQAQPLALEIGLIWIAHIGFDRLLGFGLKYQSAFGHSHLSKA